MITKIDFDVDIYNTIRKNIRKYRKEKGITSVELAEMVDTLYRISKVLDVSLDKLIEKEN